MPDEIIILYQNEGCIAFQWKRCAAKDHKKVQLVFRNTGMLLNDQELVVFSQYIKASISRAVEATTCPNPAPCRAILLRTPAEQISLAVNEQELQYLDEVVDGAIFQLGLQDVLYRLKVNT